jgi:hypothetical protein
MKDPEEQAAYNERKLAKKEAKYEQFQASFEQEGQMYCDCPHYKADIAMEVLRYAGITDELVRACNEVIIAAGGKVDHYFLHLVHEAYRYHCSGLSL